MIRRKPNGQWCDPYAAILEWLPVLMGQAGRFVFESSLKCLARYCVDQAADLYSQASASYRSTETPWRSQEEASASWGEHRHALAQKWLAKRDLLMKCLKDLEALG